MSTLIYWSTHQSEVPIFYRLWIGTLILWALALVVWAVFIVRDWPGRRVNR